MMHDEGLPDPGTLEGLIADLGTPHPDFTEDELLTGFHEVLTQSDRLSAVDTAALDSLVTEAEIGRDAHALGLELSERGEWKRAAQWLSVAARHGVADAAYELHTLERRRFSAHTTPLRDADDRGEEASASRLARLRHALTQLHETDTLAHTLKAVADGLVNDLDYEISCVNLARPDGDLVVVAVGGNDTAEAFLVGRAGPRASWNRRLSMGDRWGNVVFISHEIGWIVDGDDVPAWGIEGPRRDSRRWHPEDRLFAEMRTPQSELLGVLSVDHPRDGLLPGVWEREALQFYAAQASLAIAHARLRADAQRALVRLERERTPGGLNEDQVNRNVSLTERPTALVALPPGQPSKVLKANDALCRLLERSPSALLEFSVEDLVHPDDLPAWLRLPLGNGSCAVRLTRRDGTYLSTAMSAAPVTSRTPFPDGPRYLLTVELNRPGRRGRDLVLQRDPLTGALTGSALRAELQRLCTTSEKEQSTSLAVLFVGLDDFTMINTNHGQAAGDAVLREVTQRLTGLARPGDLIARIGGDEFALLALGRSFRQVDELVPRIHTSLTHPIRLGSHTLRLSASVGRGWAKHGMTAEQLLNTADQDMYFTKTLRKTSHLSQVS
jgi:diguanylate cyclase (GGDEF)-like protein